MTSNEAIRNELAAELGHVDPDEVVSEDSLPRMARAIASIERQMEMIQEYRDQEIQRIQETCDKKNGDLAFTRACLLDNVKQFMESKQQKKLHFPGLGKFAFRKGRESVDENEYLLMPSEDQKKVQAAHPDLFRTKVTVTPDKKAIMTVIKETGEMPEGFAVRTAPDTFDFKPEV